MSDPDKEPPFFIGWEEKPAAPIGAFLKRITFMLFALGLIVGGVVATLQRTVGTAWFDFGNVQEFSGVLLQHPAPMLISDSPVDGENILYLVSPMKFGLPAEVAENFHLKQVTLKGTFLRDKLEAMIEVVDGSVSSKGAAHAGALPEAELGSAIVRGEIVDSKCYLGLMNPGRFKPHRACAIQCLSGGIPPVLVAQTPQGQLAYYLLVHTDGSPINQAVLDYVAEPVEVAGALRTIGDHQVLYIDPITIKRL